MRRCDGGLEGDLVLSRCYDKTRQQFEFSSGLQECAVGEEQEHLAALLAHNADDGEPPAFRAAVLAACHDAGPLPSFKSALEWRIAFLVRHGAFDAIDAPVPQIGMIDHANVAQHLPQVQVCCAVLPALVPEIGTLTSAAAARVGLKVLMF